jgi:AraC-like DNA-binding protein
MVLGPKDGTVSVLIVRALLAGARAHSVTPETLCAESGVTPAQLDPSTLGDPDARVPGRVALALWSALPRLTDNESFGLALAELVGAAPITPAGWFITSSRHLEEGLQRALQYQRLLHDQSQSTLERSATEVTYVHQIGDGSFRAPRHAIEFGFAQAVLLVRRALGTFATPVRVHFQHTAPTDLGRHRSFFGSHVVFGAPRDELAFDRALCSQPLLTRDDALGELIQAHARGLLERLPNEVTWTSRVRRAIAEQLPQCLPNVDAVSARLSLAKRTLQRRLADEGTHFEAILDALRQDLAERYLAEQRFSVQETAFMLGYSDLSAFYRAFSRWHGVSPAEFRKRRLHGPV